MSVYAKLNLIGKMQHKKRIMEYVNKYLESIVKENVDQFSVEVNKHDGSLVFQSDFMDQKIIYNIKIDTFFGLCRDATDEESAKNAIDNYIVQKYYEGIVDIMKR